MRRGCLVSLDVVLRDERGRVLERSSPHAPCRYVQGTGALLEVLERAVEGLAPGACLRVVLRPEEAHGVERDLPPFRVPLARLPRARELKIGDALEVLDPIRKVRSNVWLHAIEGEFALLRREHPLAGQVLDFEIRVAAVEAPQNAAAQTA